MTRSSPQFLFPFAALLGLVALGCDSGGIGDPCIPEDEYQQNFNGFAETEVNVESKSFQCETRVCIVNHFKGRVSCPYGQTQENIDSLNPDAPARCRVPGTDGKHCLSGVEQVECSGNAGNIDSINVPVAPQLIDRTAQDTVYCSCRCKGPDPNANYCECPSGYECSELVKELGLPGRAQLAGSYCIKQGTEYSLRSLGTSECRAEQANWKVCGKTAYDPATRACDSDTTVAQACGADGNANP
jgi:hypothetical protein